MLHDELRFRILQSLGHVPTADQQQAVSLFAQFMTDRSPQAVMLLRGSAGTGKTTVAGAIVSALTLLGQKLVLMAPTGRAAKVFSLYAGHSAFTIHRRIYRQRTAGDLSSFNLNDNLHADTLFIVDEASMISQYALTEGANFGTGSLLDDLIRYVYGGRNCRLLLIGDRAQLPPVGEDEAPALAGSVLRGYGLRVYETDLDEVLRQSQASGILYNATLVRQMITHDAVTQMPRLRVRAFADISVVPGDELIESLASSYSRVGADETMVITRSNKRANIYNQGIRRTVLDREEELQRGDQLMIVKNYYKTLPQPLPAKEGNSQTLFLANGDRCIVYRVRHVEELYGFRFAEATLQFPDYDDYELTGKVMLTTLTTEAPALTREQQQQLYDQVMADYADLPLKADRVKALKDDAYYTALQVKYGYAVTCHKAQGGQWAHVYIDQGYMTDDMLTSDYFHWLYTALTRATDHVFLVNWPEGQAE
ncbi:MAG: AAA family ATPase [Prevotella sp.]|nr:AAA family ATPase [Prevotella sp.]